MKKILILLLLLIPTILLAQFKEASKYPRYEVDSLGQKVLVMTIPQAMSVNTKLELLEKYQSLSSEYNNYESVCIKVINDKEEVIAKQNITITKQDGQLKIKDDKIALLQGEILSWIERNSILEAEVKNKNDQLAVKDKQIFRMKTKMIVTGTVGVIAITAVVLFLTGTLH